MITRVYRSSLRFIRRLWLSRRIEIDSGFWHEIIEELGRRGLDGRRESGAFLLVCREDGGRCVVKAVYFDDLDPNCLVGNIHIRSIGFSNLWDLCDRQGLRVIADVHTHPGSSVAQSSTDRENPMIARDGYLALIVPHYGTHPVSAREVGVHQYRGNRGWTSWYGSEAARVLHIDKS